jgi:hypothetical protein
MGKSYDFVMQIMPKNIMKLYNSRNTYTECDSLKKK